MMIENGSRWWIFIDGSKREDTIAYSSLANLLELERAVDEQLPLFELLVLEL